MMPKSKEFRFKIDVFTPDTLPMSRLAEYMADLAMLLGTPERVHFVKLEGGSTVLVQKVEWEAVPKVKDRVGGVLSKEADPEAIKAFESIDNRLAEDNATGELVGPDQGRIIPFKGRNRPKPVVYGPFSEEGSLDGQLISIGGKSDPVPVHLEYGDKIYNCYARRDIAREMGRFLFGPILRVLGLGRWKRTETEEWEMMRFTIHQFKVLDRASLLDTVDRIRSIKSPLGELEDPISEMLKLRKGDDFKVN